MVPLQGEDIRPELNAAYSHVLVADTLWLVPHATHMLADQLQRRMRRVHFLYANTPIVRPRCHTTFALVDA